MNKKSDGSLTQAVNEYRLAVGMIADELGAQVLAAMMHAPTYSELADLFRAKDGAK